MLVPNNVRKLRWPAKSLKFKSYQPLVGPTEMQGSCTAAATKGSSRVLFIRSVRPFDNSIFRHNLATSTRDLAVEATTGGLQSIETKLNTT